MNMNLEGIIVRSLCFQIHEQTLFYRVVIFLCFLAFPLERDHLRSSRMCSILVVGSVCINTENCDFALERVFQRSSGNLFGHTRILLKPLERVVLRSSEARDLCFLYISV